MLSANNTRNVITYVMTSSFRIRNNHALYHAIELAKSHHKILHIILFKSYEENPRNNDFFKNGITGLQESLLRLADSVSIFREFDEEMIHQLQKSFLIIKDFAYLVEDKQTDKDIHFICEQNDIGFTTVESDILIPVTITSNKEEYAASTIRKKIMSKFEEYIDPINIDSEYSIGEQDAMHLLHTFMDHQLVQYINRNDPSLNIGSKLSPYLKYGFISPLTIVVELGQINTPSKESFIEELIVRRELSYNFVYYNPQYHLFKGMTYQWAYQTMKDHIYDERSYIYNIDDYLAFHTHDPYFNAAMKEMIYFGTMHSYMRMYWAKKIIEWSFNYEDAYNTIIYLNNYYFIDGNTPNGYTGVAWCFGKHDRAWAPRQIFGKIRYMNSNGLKRKFNIEEYVNIIEQKVCEIKNKQKI